MSDFLNLIDFQIKHKLNKFFPKGNRVMVFEPWNMESNCIEVANYIAEHYGYPVVYLLPESQAEAARKLLSAKVKIMTKRNLNFYLLFCRSKYLFSAHWKFPRYYSRPQKVVNLWHGIMYKKVGKMRGKNGVPADLTLATSDITKVAFAKAFGVPLDTVMIAGYPRNDMMLRAKEEKTALKARMQGNLSAYDKIIIWMPTFRTDTISTHGSDGKAADNAFQIEGFDVDGFNRLLQKYNTLCIVKPHPLDVQRPDDHAHSHVLIIKDDWLWQQGLTLYHLAAVSDILVSDISSIICDYLLLNQPIICFTTDLDEYKASRGFYFEDIENWLPSALVRNESEFLIYLEQILATGIDPCEQKRLGLKDKFFAYHDANSTKRLLEHVFTKN